MTYRFLFNCGIKEFRREIKKLSAESLEWMRGRVSKQKEIALLDELMNREPTQ